MVKIAPDKSLPQTKNRGQRLTLTGDRAPATAHYEELDVFGSPIGAVVHVHKGDALPSAPRSFTWRRIRREGC
jgi:hypothetical protein